MDNPRPTPGALRAADELTTFYASEGGAARSLVLSNMAWLLSGRHAGVPGLMIDWDLDAPALHGLFDTAAARPGLLELFTDGSTKVVFHGNRSANWRCCAPSAPRWPAWAIHAGCQPSHRSRRNSLPCVH